MYRANAIKLMIASPSDVAQERQIVREVIHEWNAIHSEDKAVVVMPIGWESHARPSLGDRPQAIINKQILRGCDALVAAASSLWLEATPELKRQLQAAVVPTGIDWDGATFGTALTAPIFNTLGRISADGDCVVTPTIPSWNQINAFVRDMADLRQWVENRPSS